MHMLHRRQPCKGVPSGKFHVDQTVQFRESEGATPGVKSLQQVGNESTVCSKQGLVSGIQKGPKFKTYLVKGDDVDVIVHSRQAVDFLLEQIGVEAWRLFADDFDRRQNAGGDLLSKVGHAEGPSSQLVRSNIPLTCYNVESILQVRVLYRTTRTLVPKPMGLCGARFQQPPLPAHSSFAGYVLMESCWPSARASLHLFQLCTGQSMSTTHVEF